jgi:hypothetical protein
MTQSKRPKLGQVLRGQQEPPTAVRVPPAAPPAPAPAPDSEKMVQLNVNVPESLRRALRIKALQQGKEVNAIVRTVLQEWIDS